MTKPKYKCPRCKGRVTKTGSKGVFHCWDKGCGMGVFEMKED